MFSKRLNYYYIFIGIISVFIVLYLTKLIWDIRLNAYNEQIKKQTFLISKIINKELTVLDSLNKNEIENNLNLVYTIIPELTAAEIIIIDSKKNIKNFRHPNLNQPLPFHLLKRQIF